MDANNRCKFSITRAVGGGAAAAAAAGAAGAAGKKVKRE
jgi:hypothetical protein